jgi:hypothetical protein
MHKAGFADDLQALMAIGPGISECLDGAADGHCAKIMAISSWRLRVAGYDCATICAVEFLRFLFTDAPAAPSGASAKCRQLRFKRPYRMFAYL